MESCVCLGNVIVLFFSYEPLAALYLLIPIVLIEALILKAVLKLPFMKILLACFLANALSTYCGLAMVVFEALGYLTIPLFGLGFFILLSLFVVMFLLSFYVERWYYLRQWKDLLPVKSISKACFFANLATYAPLLFMTSYLSDHSPGEIRRHERSYRISCFSNLKQIGLAIRQYAIDNGGFLPCASNGANFELLRSSGYLTDYKIFVCPSSKAKIPKEGSALKEENVSYLYFGAGLTSNDSPDSAIACDKPGNHEKYGNALFLDGHAQGCPGTKWMEGAGISKTR